MTAAKRPRNQGGRPTIVSVAKRAEVSIATVSRVLNGNVPVAAETRKRVEAAIAALHFAPHPAAQALVHGRTRTIGVIMSTLLDEYWAAFAEQICGETDRAGYSLLLERVAQSEEIGGIIKRVGAQRKADGIILLPQAQGNKGDRAILESAALSSGVPVVVFDREAKRIPSVISLHREAAAKGTSFLISLGHRRIAMVGIPREQDDLKNDDRELGYRDAMEAHGLQVDEALVRRTGRYGIEAGYEETLRLTESEAGVTAIFAWNDTTAIGVINALRSMQIRVPEDVSVLGYDDIQMARYFRPPLSTMRQKVEPIVKLLVGLLLDALGGGRTVTHHEVPLELVVRESTAEVGGHGRS